MTSGPYSPLPEASLILCSRNRPSMLVETVENILGGDELPAELIVVDQSDAPNPLLQDSRTAGGCTLRYHWMETPGLSRGNNVGVRMARHDLLVFTHDDVRVPPGWFGTLLRALLAAGPETVVTGRVLGETDGPGSAGFVPSTRADEEPRVWEAPTPEGVLYPMSMALHRSVLDDVGPFDERLGPGTPFPAAEDNDLAYRLLRTGHRIAYEPRAVLHHRAWRPDSDFRALRWSYGRGQGAYYAKHMGLRDGLVLRHLGGELRYRIGKALKRLLREPGVAAGEAVYLAGLASGLAGWLIAHGLRTDEVHKDASLGGAPPAPDRPEGFGGSDGAAGGGSS